ncbi:Hypothetical predicted protein [Lecanosticta acicola]|uniref:Uncharacterized protein n=1 Tax=Lecanosticta acicola TaxID=111012 RepID=A0AAI9E8W3_9PEZI|nr:Hypothetical predicted protein [Lecanosticta acicola]
MAEAIAFAAVDHFYHTTTITMPSPKRILKRAAEKTAPASSTLREKTKSASSSLREKTKTRLERLSSKARKEKQVYNQQKEESRESAHLDAQRGLRAAKQENSEPVEALRKAEKEISEREDRKVEVELRGQRDATLTAVQEQETAAVHRESLLKQDLKQVRAQLATQTQAATKLQTRLEDAEEKNRITETKFSRLQAQVELDKRAFAATAAPTPRTQQLQDQLNAAQASVKGLRAQHQDFIKQIKDLQSENAKLSKSLKYSQVSPDDLHEECRLDIKCAQGGKKMAEEKWEKEKVAHQATKHQRKAEMLKVSNEKCHVQQDLALAEHRLKTFKAQHVNCPTKISEIAKKRDQYRADLETTKQNADDLQKKLDSVALELKDVKAKLETAREDFEDMTGARDHLAQLLDDKDGECDRKEEKCDASGQEHEQESVVDEENGSGTTEDSHSNVSSENAGPGAGYQLLTPEMEWRLRAALGTINPGPSTPTAAEVADLQSQQMMASLLTHTPDLQTVLTQLSPVQSHDAGESQITYGATEYDPDSPGLAMPYDPASPLNVFEDEEASYGADEYDPASTAAYQTEAPFDYALHYKQQSTRILAARNEACYEQQQDNHECFYWRDLAYMEDLNTGTRLHDETCERELRDAHGLEKAASKFAVLAENYAQTQIMPRLLVEQSGDPKPNPNRGLLCDQRVYTKSKMSSMESPDDEDQAETVAKQEVLSSFPPAENRWKAPAGNDWADEDEDDDFDILADAARRMAAPPSTTRSTGGASGTIYDQPMDEEVDEELEDCNNNDVDSLSEGSITSASEEEQQVNSSSTSSNITSEDESGATTNPTSEDEDESESGEESDCETDDEEYGNIDLGPSAVPSAYKRC